MSKKKVKEKKPDIYGELVDFQDRLHAQNLKRIHIGLLCVLIIPMIFLALMFITDSNKVIWLILWIVSLFAISAYLIVVEYGDYNLQHRINSITGNEAEPVPLLESGLIKLSSVRDEARDIIASAKESVNLDEYFDEDKKIKDSDIYSAGIDTELIKENIEEDNSITNDEDAVKASSSGKKNKKSKKNKKGKKNKDKNNKKSKSKKKDSSTDISKDNDLEESKNTPVKNECLKDKDSKKSKNKKKKKDKSEKKKDKKIKKNKNEKTDTSANDSRGISLNDSEKISLKKEFLEADLEDTSSENNISVKNMVKEEAFDE